MRISKQTKKTTLAQQGRYLLICLLSMLLLFLAGSVLIQPKSAFNRNGQNQPGLCFLEIYGSDGEGSV